MHEGELQLLTGVRVIPPNNLQRAFEERRKEVIRSRRERRAGTVGEEEELSPWAWTKPKTEISKDYCPSAGKEEQGKENPFRALFEINFSFPPSCSSVGGSFLRSCSAGAEQVEPPTDLAAPAEADMTSSCSFRDEILAANDAYLLHGTKPSIVRLILTDGFKPAKGIAVLDAFGVYTTDDIRVADKYAIVPVDDRDAEAASAHRDRNSG